MVIVVRKEPMLTILAQRIVVIIRFRRLQRGLNRI